MIQTLKTVRGAAVVAALGALAAGCESSELTPLAPSDAVFASGQRGGPRAALKDHSVTPALVNLKVPGAKAYSIISSDDDLPQSPGYVFGGSADGAGLLSNSDGTFTLLVNHEDNFAVSRVTLDEEFKPVTGEYILNSDFGRWRLCSATMATPDAHGFGPVFLTVGESGVESMIHAVDPFGPPNSSRLLSALGRWNSENAVPLPAQAYPGRTVIVIGDDDSGAQGGQVAMYVGNGIGDLDNGNLYVLARADGNIRERDIEAGESYDVVFKQIPDQETLTGRQINLKTAELGAVQFGRVEDLDYRKAGAAGGREIYFNVTGQNNSGVNADYSRSKYGRIYRLKLDPRDPTRGTIEVVLDGDDRSASNPVSQLQNPDNIMVTRNYVYVQEDSNGYGDETHDAYIYQYNIHTGETKVVMELDHRRDEVDAAKYNVGGRSRFGSWEYGAMLDVTDQLGGNGNSGTFLLAIQPHTWRDERFRGVDGGTRRASENQGSQIVVVTGLPR